MLKFVIVQFALNTCIPLNAYALLFSADYVIIIYIKINNFKNLNPGPWEVLWNEKLNTYKGPVTI